MTNNLVDPPEHLRCTAKANRTDKRCRRAAISGSNVCPTHGGRAPAVKRRAAQRVALARAAELLSPDAPDVDPAEVLIGAVKASAATLGAAEAAIRAEEPDADALHQLGEAALLAGRLAKLALDSGIEARLARQAEQAGELVGDLIRRTVEALELPAEVQAAAFRHIRSEVEVLGVAAGPLGRLSVAELDEEIGRVVQALDDHARADALAGFPDRLARAVNAALGPLNLSDADKEKALAAVEAFLAADALEQAEREQERRQQVAVSGPGGWWVAQAATYRNGNNGTRQ